MLSETLNVELARYEIGPKIRLLRLAKGISLVELGRHSGLSSGLLSKIERGLLVPPLPTLMRIALVFSVGLEHFFVERAKPLMAVVRKAERLRLPDDPARQPPAYVFESLSYPVTDRRMDAYLAEFRSESLPHAHIGPEFIYVVKGLLVINMGGTDTELSEGDSAYFDSSHSHSYRPNGRAPCMALVVVEQPRGASAQG
jgi:transcriptional regulator with XRE-family HTH domain